MPGRTMVVRLVLLSALCMIAPADRTFAQAGGGATAASPDMRWAVKIPMRDGVLLNATVFQPHLQKDPLPVIFTLTPYIGDSYTDRAMYFAQHGYVYALVDVRGRGNSGGVFEPFVNDAKDGYDVVEWFAKQPYCTGKVTMWGGSYAGFDQWSTLKEFPPHLATIVPAAAAHPGVDFPFQYNIFGPYDEQWLTFTSGVTSNENLFGNSSFWAAKAREYYDGHRAYREYDGIVGNPSVVFQKWVQHPIPDEYYDAMVPSPEAYKRIQIPILTITGHYDGDQPGAFTYYKRHMEYGTPEAKQNHFLIIGPWDHAGTRTPRREVGGLKFGEASVLDLNKLHTEWYDWVMKAGKKPEFLKKRVAYYVVGAGAENWKYADSLEGISNEMRTLYLGSNGDARSVFQSGRLSEKPGAGAATDEWTYDPLDTRPGDAEPDEDAAGLTSQRALLNTYGNGAIYHSDPFSEPTEVTGFLKLTVWLKMDVADTDLEAEVYEILPGGESVYLTGATMRARYRESLRKEKLVVPGKTEKYTFDNFTFFSRRIAKGSRLRLFVHCLNTTGSEKNYNSGGVVALETSKDAKTAHITLVHDSEHQSTLEMPIVK
ncbi:MAG TPA: CocE/NonD family hydrolase [Candidatus Acidoferrum sp.]|nr:CocE/NonD family hydrolase [Candidatus Acidoferrum sp.]